MHFIDNVDKRLAIVKNLCQKRSVTNMLQFAAKMSLVLCHLRLS